MTKVVLSSILIYTMSCYDAPMKVENGFEGFLKKFLWEGSKNDKKIPLVSWDMACKPKVDGRVGLRKVRLQNMTLGSKLVWKMYNHLDKLWCCIIQKIYLDCSSPSRILTVENLEGGLAVWNFTRKFRPSIMSHLSWRIGNGHRDDFWIDSYNGHRSLVELFDLE